MSSLRAKVKSRLKGSVRAQVISKLRSARDMDSRQAFTLSQQFVEGLNFEELKDIHANGVNLRKVHTKLTKMNAKKQAKIDEVSNRKRNKNGSASMPKKANPQPQQVPNSQSGVMRAASRSAARRKNKMDVWASMMAFDVELKKKEDKDKAKRDQDKLNAYRKELAAQNLEKRKRLDREKRAAREEARRINADVRRYEREQAEKQKQDLLRAARIKREASEMEQIRQRRLADEADQDRKDREMRAKKMADDVAKLRQEEADTLKRKKEEEHQLKIEIDKHNEHLRKMKLEEQEYFNSIQRESERRFQKQTRKRREKKEARDRAMQAKVDIMNKIHKSHEKMMAKQNKQEELGRAMTQARRDAEQRAKVEKRKAQEKAMYEAITDMKMQKALRRKKYEEEEERFAAIVNADARKYRQELEAEKQRKKDQIEQRKIELDVLSRRDIALKKDREIPLAVLAINKPLLNKVQQSQVSDVTGYLKKVEESPPSKGKGRRRRRRRTGTM